MSAWTRTYVKANSLPKELVNKICDDVISEVEKYWYYRRGRRDIKDVVNKLLTRYKSASDNYEIPEEKLTFEYIEKDVRQMIAVTKDYINDLKLVKEDKMSFDDCLRKYKVWADDSLINTPICSFFEDDSVWLSLRNYEIFRLREYSDFDIKNGINTVDGLIKYLKKPTIQSILYSFDDLAVGLTPKLEKEIREFYGQFGDRNFSVTFG